MAVDFRGHPMFPQTGFNGDGHVSRFNFKDGNVNFRARVRLVQQMSFGPRASIGGSIFENEFVKEEGVIAYHYANPVSGRTELPKIPSIDEQMAMFPVKAE